MNTCVINVYVAVFKPSVEVYDFAPAIEFQAVVIFGTIHKFVAVPSLTHIFNNNMFPLVAAVRGTFVRLKSSLTPVNVIIVA